MTENIVVIACREFRDAQRIAEMNNVFLVMANSGCWWINLPREKVIELYGCSRRVKCPKCGSKYENWNRFCPRCGTRLIVDEYSTPRQRVLSEVIYLVSTAKLVIVVECDDKVLPTMLGLLGKKYGAKLVWVGEGYASQYADLRLGSSSSLLNLLFNS